MNTVYRSSRKYWGRRGRELVDIDFERAEEFAGMVEGSPLPEPGDGELDDPVDYLNATMFSLTGDACFWTDDGYWYYRGEKGSRGWERLIRELYARGMREGSGPHQHYRAADYFSRLSTDEFRQFLEEGGAGNLQLVEGRVANLNEAGRVLKEKYGGDFRNLLRRAGHYAPRIVTALSRNFPRTWGRDRFETEEGTVRIYKRASLAPILLYEGLPVRGYGQELYGLDRITVAADYRLPQVLRGLEVLKYAPSLDEKIRRKEVLEEGSPEELAIRTATIVACNAIMKELQKRGDYNIAHVDAFLFFKGREFRAEEFHRVRTLNY